MKRRREDFSASQDGYFRRHPVFANLIVICLVGFIGIWIAYLALKLFTNHGASEMVPSVENMSYTQAINTLHDANFRVDIRDSIFNEEYKPGYVIEQFPKAGAYVKPGRKIFLYINAVHPREVVIDSDNMPGEDALRGYSYRQGLARLEELGFRHVQTEWVPGDNDRIINVLAQGQPVKKLQKVPVTSPIVVRVYDGKLRAETDSLEYEEYLSHLNDEDFEEEQSYGTDFDDTDLEPVFVQ